MEGDTLLPMKLTLPVLALTLAMAPYAVAQMPPSTAAQDHDAAAMPIKPRVPPSHGVTVSFEGHVTSFTVEQMLAMPQVTVHVHNAHRNTEEIYTGPLLSDVLAQAGLVASRETEPLILHSSVIATGTDQYFVLYSAAEVEPMFSRGQVIVALTKGNDLPNEEGGNIELINTDGAKPARWLHGLQSLRVITMSQNR
jgi:hypothetical protein